MTRSKSGKSARGQTTVHFYSVCWNEEYILPHFLAHHRALFDRIVVVDDGSTDRSLKLLRKEANVEVRIRQRDASESYIWLNTEIYNQSWKESRGKADWVVVGNIDEFTYCRDLRGYLDDCTARGVTVVPVLGFEMVSRPALQAGQQLMRSVRTGAPAVPFSRFAIFNPDAIDEIGYLPGRHECRPTGEIVLPPDDRVLNLHYKRVGLENTFARMQVQNLRRIEFDRKFGLGHEYGRGWSDFLEDWGRIEADSFDVFDWYRREAPYPGEVWWRLGDRGFMTASGSKYIQKRGAEANDHTSA